jgi:long-subunit acyl-CoA synthetase (AMP-forming)
VSPGLLLDAILRHAGSRPQEPALSDGHEATGYGALAQEVEAAAGMLRAAAPRCLAIAMENSPAWAVMDLAALSAGVPAVPMPAFFSAAQQAHVLRDAGVDLLATDDPAGQLLALTAGCTITASSEVRIAGRPLRLMRLAGNREADLPRGTAKITYTSGTTGNPKGVCLGAAAMEEVAASLARAAALAPGERHLAALPLPTLLENVGGVYAPLLAGGCAVLPPLRAVGVEGAARFEAGLLAIALWAQDAASVILTPQMLQGLLAALEAGMLRPPRLRFAAVGGAPVAQRLLARSARLGLPVFEGYGLSECASVVALNTSGGSKPGSTGRPLPHARVSIAPDGEILVEGSVMLGYAGQTAPAPRAWPTGDLGYLDPEGFLHVTGRKKNMFITSFGRNVAPEWVERELTLHPAVAQAAVFGEGRPWNVAVIVPRGRLEPETIGSALAEANAQLPDYARVGAWLAADAPFTPGNGQLTVNGRLRRDAIRAAYQERIDELYREELDGVSQ